MKLDAATDPLDLFHSWLEQARERESVNPDAFSLATVDDSGCPDVRYLLLKRVGADGLEFFTNRASAKSRQLQSSGQAAAAIYWRQTGRQVRARGPVEELAQARVAEYFATRGRDSQAGAWASRQSSPLEDFASIQDDVEKIKQRFEGQEIPLPDHWTGYRLVPLAIEFWQEGEARIHERFRFERAEPGAGWRCQRLYP